MYIPGTSALRPGADAIIYRTPTLPWKLNTVGEKRREQKCRASRPNRQTETVSKRDRGRGKRDHGMTYIWPTGRRVELSIQFALKHSLLRFISFQLLLPFRDYPSYLLFFFFFFNEFILRIRASGFQNFL